MQASADAPLSAEARALGLPHYPAGTRFEGEERAHVIAVLIKAYRRSGRPGLRLLAEATGIARTRVRSLLLEGGVELRPVGRPATPREPHEPATGLDRPTRVPVGSGCGSRASGGPMLIAGALPSAPACAVAGQTLGNSLGASDGQHGDAVDAVGMLTPVQAEVLQLIAMGRSVTEVGLSLRLSYAMVTHHLIGAGRRLGRYSDAGRVDAALSTGQITPLHPVPPPPVLDETDLAVVHALRRLPERGRIAAHAGLAEDLVPGAIDALLAKAGARTPAHLVALVHTWRLRATSPHADPGPALLGPSSLQGSATRPVAPRDGRRTPPISCSCSPESR
jgi:DNA-binding CsgD family transcriptional regulator